MKVSLIMVRPRHSSYGIFSIAPLGIIYLGTILKNRGYDVTVYDEARSHIFNEKKGQVAPSLLDSDFIGLSLISPAANRGLRMLRAIDRQNPRIRTGVGGPHVLGREQAEEFARYADVVVQREGEGIIEEVIGGQLNGIVNGPRIEDLDQLPIPDLSILADNNHKLKDFFRLTPITTTRGCPRNCEFCTVSNIHGKKVRHRSTELVMQELRKRAEEGYRRIFFADDNFSVQPSKRSPMLDAMIREQGKGRWFESMIVQDEVPGILRGGEEHVQKMRRAGIRTVMLGVESFDDEKLHALHKTHSKTDSERAIRLLHNHGMIIYAFGMAKPEIDDRDSIRRQFKKLREEGVTYADMTIETPFPGTPYWEKYKSKLTATRNGLPDWDKWTLLCPVIPTHHMSQKAFQRAVKENMQWFYSPWRALRRMLQGKIRSGLTILYVWFTTGRMYS
ncbi:MAG: B12-binding domain-containing radical SAM protein [Bacteroidales bacterium]|nr:B12-binding domain-containing radical SAM protein [Bacteroidales bacterium]